MDDLACFYHPAVHRDVPRFLVTECDQTLRESSSRIPSDCAHRSSRLEIGGENSTDAESGTEREKRRDYRLRFGERQ